MPVVSKENDFEKILNRLSRKYTEEEGNVISLLQNLQDEFGYIPEKAVDRLSKELDIPESRFFGIMTFYSQFYLKPRGKNTIQVCLGTACYAKGAENILSKIETDLKTKVGETTEDRKFSLDAVRCLGACGLAPVMVISHDIHAAVRTKNVKKIIDKYND